MSVIYDWEQIYNDFQDTERLKAIQLIQLIIKDKSDSCLLKPVSGWEDVAGELVRYCTGGMFSSRSKKFKAFLKESVICERRSIQANQIIASSVSGEKYKKIANTNLWLNTSCKINWLISFFYQAFDACGIQSRDIWIRCEDTTREEILRKTKIELDTRQSVLVDKASEIAGRQYALETKEASCNERAASLEACAVELNERASALDVREVALNSRQFSLDAREKSLVERKSSLDAREKSLVEKQSLLDTREKSLVEKQSSLESAEKLLIERQSSLDAREKALGKRKSSLDVCEKSLVEKQSLLDTHEKALVEREMGLDAREVALNSRQSSLDTGEKALGKRKSSLDAREKSLVERESSLDAREKSLVEKQSSLDAREVVLGKRAIALDAREVALNEQAAALDACMSALDKRERALDKQAAALAEREDELADREIIKDFQAKKDVCMEDEDAADDDAQDAIEADDEEDAIEADDAQDAIEVDDEEEDDITDDVDHEIIVPFEIGDTPYIVLNGSIDYAKMIGSKPVAAYYKGEKFVESKVWSQIYQEFFQLLLRKDRRRFRLTKNLDSILFDKSEYRNGMIGARSARFLATTNYCIVIQKNTNQLLSDMQKVIDEWQFNGSDFLITYKPDDTKDKSYDNAVLCATSIQRRTPYASPSVIVRRKQSQPQIAEHASDIQATVGQNIEKGENITQSIGMIEQTFHNTEKTPHDSSKCRNKNISISNGRIGMAYLSEICKIAKTSQNFQAFIISYILLHGSQTQRDLIDNYCPQQGIEATYRGILYNMERSASWLVKEEIGNKRFAFGIPDPQLCLSDPYVQKLLANVGVERHVQDSGFVAVSEAVIGADDDMREVIRQSVADEPLPEPPSLEPDDDEEMRIAEVLRRYFKEGYGGGAKQQYRFEQRFEEQNDRRCSLEGLALDAAIARLTWQIDDKGYLPETVLSDEKADMLMETIARMFGNGAPYIEYQALIDMQHETNNSYLLPIKTAEELSLYLRYTCADYVYFRQKISESKTLKTPDLMERITEYVLHTGRIVSLDELRKEFPFLSRKTILQRMDHAVILETKTESYLHVENVALDENDYREIGEYVASELRTSSQLPYNRLFEVLPEHLAECLKNLYEDSKDLMVQLLKKRYGNLYKFGTSGITRVGDGASGLDASLENEFDHQARITMTDIEDWMKRIGTTSYSTVFTYIYDHFCRISESDFVKAEEVTFDIATIDGMLDAQRSGDYLLMKDITFDQFPYAGYQWNKYLLYSYIYRYSQRYKLRNLGGFPFKKGEGGIAMIKNIQMPYDDILVAFLLSREPFPSNEDDAVALLAEFGLIERKNQRARNIYRDATRKRARTR